MEGGDDLLSSCQSGGALCWGGESETNRSDAFACLLSDRGAVTVSEYLHYVIRLCGRVAEKVVLSGGYSLRGGDDLAREKDSFELHGALGDGKGIVLRHDRFVEMQIGQGRVSFCELVVWIWNWSVRVTVGWLSRVSVVAPIVVHLVSIDTWVLHEHGGSVPVLGGGIPCGTWGGFGTIHTGVCG